MDDNDLFVIAAGGTGAKVAEALTHLLAAGLGPRNVYLLLVDGDMSNGNRNRTVATLEDYGRLQAWPWLVRYEENPDLTVRLFNSNVRFFTLAERFDDVNRVGLLPQILGDSSLEQALRVLLNQSELTSDLSIGFAGRPNLGCLVMDGYLRHHFVKHPQAKAFLHALENSARSEDRKPRVVVVGSVFGGTGASLLPVVRRCIDSLFQQPNSQNQPRQHLCERLRWGKVMQLPYFRPEGSGSSNVLNSNRHLTDTSSALWYYGEIMRGERYDPTYLIGSESPHSRVIAAVVGGADQINPAFYHEIIAALAVLDFHQNPDVVDGRPIRHFGTQELGEECSIDNLPIPAGETKLLEKLATALHLAAFWINWRPDEPVAFRRGLLHYSKSAVLTGWDSQIQNWLVTRRHELTDKAGPARQALTYFGRLLLWANTCLGANGATGLAFLSDDDVPSHYSSLHNTLCYVPRSEICVKDGQQEYQQQDDNLAARLLRLALAGLMRQNASQGKDDYRGHRFNLGTLRLVEDGARIRVGLLPNQLGQSLTNHGLEGSHVRSLCRSYGLSKLAPPP